MGILVGLNTSATNNLIMKFLVLFAVVASAAANLVTHPNGAVTPALTPEVAAATAAHLAAKGPEVVAAEQAHFAAHGIAAPVAHAYAAGYPYGFAGYPYAVAGVPAGLVAHPNGAVVPVEPQDVIDARAAHLAAHA